MRGPPGRQLGISGDASGRPRPDDVRIRIIYTSEGSWDTDTGNSQDGGEFCGVLYLPVFFTCCKFIADMRALNCCGEI